MGAIVRDSYSELVGDFDLLKGTGTELAARFREYGLTGATLAKAVRFYLGAMDSAEIKYPPHIAPPLSTANALARSPQTVLGVVGAMWTTTTMMMTRTAGGQRCLSQRAGSSSRSIFRAVTTRSA